MTTFAELAAQGAVLFSDGYRTKRDELGDSGFRVLRVADVEHGWVTLEGNDFVLPGYASQIGAKVARDGDIIVTTKGTIGRVAVVTGLGDERVVYSPQLCFFRVMDQNRISSAYLRYWFSSPEAVRQIGVYSGNTDMAPYLSLRDLRSMRIGLPELRTQRAIGAVLGALDEKIAVDRRAEEKYLSLIPAIFKAAVNMSLAFTEVPLTQIATFTKGVSYRSEDLDTDGDSYLVGLKTVGRRGGFQRRGLRKYVGAARPGQEIAQGEIVIAQTDLTQNAEVVGRAVRVPRLPGGRRGFASLDLAIARPVASVQQLYLLGVLSQPAFQRHCRSHVTGTTVLHLARTAMPTYFVPLLSESEQALYAKKVAPMYAAADALAEERAVLAKTRDELLPLLMSGKITVKEAEKRVEGVV